MNLKLSPEILKKLNKEGSSLDELFLLFSINEGYSELLEAYSNLRDDNALIIQSLIRKGLIKTDSSEDENKLFEITDIGLEMLNNINN